MKRSRKGITWLWKESLICCHSAPQQKIAEKPVRRLIKLGEKKDRSVNSLVVEAILEYLRREEKKGL